MQLFFASLLVASAISGVLAESERDAFPYPVHSTELPNGLKVMSVPYDSPGIISYYTVVRTGSRNEVEPGLSGFAHFFEHMMFRGTPRFSESEYNNALKGLGADSNAFTTDDWTCYHITASAAALETIMDLEADRFQNLKYDEPAFQKEARAVLGEYNKSASSPMLLLNEKMQDTAFTTHTYKHTTIGFLKDIEDMPNQYEYSLKFFDRWYRPENSIVLVVGDVKHERLVELAKKYYGNWKRGSTKIEIPREPEQKEERKLDLTWKGQTLPYLYLGYHVPAFEPTNRDVAALDVLAEAAFSKTSPLYRKLVLDERKAEVIFSMNPFNRDPTLFRIMVRLTSAEHFDSVRDEIYRTLKDLAEKPLPAERLADIKSHMRYSFTMNLDTPDGIAEIVADFLQLTAEPKSINQLYRTYDEVTPKDIQRVAAKYFVPTNRTVITLRQESSEESTSRATTESGRTLAAVDRSLSPSVDPPVEVSTSEDRDDSGVISGCATGLTDDPPAKGSRKSGGDNMTVILNSSPLVALRVAFHAGSMNDPPGREGLAALTARMIAEGGTRRYSYEQILERLYPMAGGIGEHCDKEITVFTGDIHRDKLDEFYDLFAEMIREPRFDPADFQRLREEQINYISKILRGNDDETLGKWTLQLMLFPPKHPYGHVDAGTVSGLKKITLDDVKQFYRTHYARSNVHLGVAGGADQAFVKRYRDDFAKLPDAEVTVPELPEPHHPKNMEVTIVQKETIATAISIGFPIDLTRSDDDFYALAVANSAFGEHRTFNGRLMINMRGKRGLNYGDYAYIENFIQEGMSTFPIPNIPRRQQHFSIWIRPVPHDKAVFATRQATRESDMLVENGLTESEFETTRKFLLNYSKLWVQSLSRRLGYAMDGQFYERDSLVEELDRRLPKLTLEQVNAAIKKHLQSKNLAVAVVTRDAESFRDAILSGKPSPIEYDTQGTPAEILEEDKSIEKFPLPINKDRVRIVPVEQMFE